MHDHVPDRLPRPRWPDVGLGRGTAGLAPAAPDADRVARPMAPRPAHATRRDRARRPAGHQQLSMPPRRDRNARPSRSQRAVAECPCDALREQLANPVMAGGAVQIAILGAGQVGSTLGRLWHAAGHDVTFAARGAARPQALAAELGGRARAASVAGAVADAKVVLVAVPGPVVNDVLKAKI